MHHRVEGCDLTQCHHLTINNNYGPNMLHDLPHTLHPLQQELIQAGEGREPDD